MAGVDLLPKSVPPVNPLTPPKEKEAKLTKTQKEMLEKIDREVEIRNHALKEFAAITRKNGDEEIRKLTRKMTDEARPLHSVHGKEKHTKLAEIENKYRPLTDEVSTGTINKICAAEKTHGVFLQEAKAQREAVFKTKE